MFAATADSPQVKQTVKPDTPSKGSSQSYRINDATSKEASRSLTKATTDNSLPNESHIVDENHAIDVTVRVEKETRTYTSSYSRAGVARSPARNSPFSPPLNESLFKQPSTPSSSSPQPEEEVHSSSRKVVASRLTFDEIDEAEERGEELHLSSHYSPTRPDHVNEAPPEAPSPPTRPSVEREAVDSRAEGHSSTSKLRRDTSRPLKRKVSPAHEVHADRAPAGPQEESLFTEDEQESTPPPEPKRHRAHSVASKAQQRKLGSLESFADWTWPAVQETIKEYRCVTCLAPSIIVPYDIPDLADPGNPDSASPSATSVSSKMLPTFETCLSRKFEARVSDHMAF